MDPDVPWCNMMQSQGVAALITYIASNRTLHRKFSLQKYLFWSAELSIVDCRKFSSAVSSEAHCLLLSMSGIFVSGQPEDCICSDWRAANIFAYPVTERQSRKEQPVDSSSGHTTLRQRHIDVDVTWRCIDVNATLSQCYV